jgi:spore maturation protein CgeB
VRVKVGFYMKWPKGSLERRGNVIGDELYAESMCRALRTLDGVEGAELYAPNAPPPPGLDVLVYLNDTPPERGWARRHVLYVQNAYGDGSDAIVARLRAARYDGYAFISNKLLGLHRAAGHEGIFLPFGVETSVFRPMPPSPDLAWDVAYVGNDIKGKDRTERYLMPAVEHRLGLYGNWALKRHGLKVWRRWTRHHAYQRRLEGLSQGKIPQERVPVLYSSAKVNLNVTIQDCVDWDVITLRTFEVLACRGFLVTDRVEVAERELAGCVVFTDGGDDLRDKLRHYLAHEEERRAIAEAGHRWVLANATVESRVATLHAYLRSLQ